MCFSFSLLLLLFFCLFHGTVYNQYFTEIVHLKTLSFVFYERKKQSLNCIQQIHLKHKACNSFVFYRLMPSFFFLLLIQEFTKWTYMRNKMTRSYRRRHYNSHERYMFHLQLKGRDKIYSIFFISLLFKRLSQHTFSNVLIDLTEQLKKHLREGLIYDVGRTCASRIDFYWNPN